MPLTLYSSLVVALVAIVSYTLMVLTWIAANRTGHTRIRFVSAAFGVHGVKSTFIAIALLTQLVEHELLEMIEALFDLVMVTLLAIPFWARP